jgi:hypothetical protein
MESSPSYMTLCKNGMEYFNKRDGVFNKPYGVSGNSEDASF